MRPLLDEASSISKTDQKQIESLGTEKAKLLVELDCLKGSMEELSSSFCELQQEHENQVQDHSLASEATVTA